MLIFSLIIYLLNFLIMTKKLWLLLLSLFAIFWFWVSFANPIAPADLPDVCYRIKNVEIDGYRVIIESGKRNIKKSWQTDSFGRAEPGRKREVYELKQNECTKCSEFHWGSISKAYLLDKSIDIKDITQENLDNMAIFMWDIGDSDCASNYDRIKTYKIEKDWDMYEIVLNGTRNIKSIKEFPFFRLWTVIIETLLLFYVGKLFWEEKEISNKKLILFWIIPTTVTLPLLRFVLPLLIWDEIQYTIIWELLVTIIEAIIIKYWLKVSRGKAILVSIICNLFSFIVLSYGDTLSSRGEFLYHFIKIYLLMVVFILPIILTIILKSLQKDEEISNKRFILVWIFAPIWWMVAAISVVSLIWWLLNWSDLLGVAGVWIYVLVELFVIKYWLKISRSKSITAFFLSIIWLLIVGFVVMLCLGM